EAVEDERHEARPRPREALRPGPVGIGRSALPLGRLALRGALRGGRLRRPGRGARLRWRRGFGHRLIVAGRPLAVMPRASRSPQASTGAAPAAIATSTGI